MAVIRCEFFSKNLWRLVEFIAVVPNDAPFPAGDAFKRPAKTMYLLHGHSGANSDWLYNSPLTQLAGQYNMNFVMPSGENWFYLDNDASDRKYAKFVGEELVEYTRKTFGFSDKAEDTFIGGLSMGGFGALHTGLLYNHTFSKIMALSSALIVHEVSTMKEGEANPIANYEYYRMVFGDLSKAVCSINNPETIITEKLEAGEQLPDIYMAIGTEDFLYQNNQEFRAFLEANNVKFRYEEGPGVHDFKFWNEHLPKAIEYFLDESQEILDIKVSITRCEECRLTENVKELKLYFSAEANSKFFKGKTTEEFFDRQIIANDKPVDCCADYVLEGFDSAGKECKIHIINHNDGSGWVPTLKTDSVALSFVNKGGLKTVTSKLEDGIEIHIMGSPEEKF